ncbi:MAG TPA: hypothetical protein VG013_27020 [Gemmataceae bacterium]|nr:hypothetical protein [Gemmataceae bacterium]
MKPDAAENGLSSLVLVRPEPSGQFTAQVVGLPELRETAASREEALRRVQARLVECLASGELVAMAVPAPHPVMKWFGRANPLDPDEQAYLAELARQRQEDLERTLRECDSACSSSSSTPTT